MSLTPRTNLNSTVMKSELVFTLSSLILRSTFQVPFIGAVVNSSREKAPRIPQLNRGTVLEEVTQASEKGSDRNRDK